MQSRRSNPQQALSGWLWLLALVAFLRSVGASAEPGPVTVLVLDFTPGATDREAAKAAGELVAATLAARQDLEVTSGEDIRRALALESEKSLVGCDDESCAAEVAGALGAELVVFGRGTRLGQLSMIHLTLLDASTGKTAGRSRLTFEEPEQLLDRVGPACAHLFEEEMARRRGRPFGNLSSRAWSEHGGLWLAIGGGAIVAASVVAAVTSIAALGSLFLMQTMALSGAEAAYRSPGATGEEKRAALDQAAFIRSTMGVSATGSGLALATFGTTAASAVPLLVASGTLAFQSPSALPPTAGIE